MSGLIPNTQINRSSIDHKIRFVNVTCPDHLCEGFGFISLPTQTAVCMPNRVSVLIDGR